VEVFATCDDRLLSLASRRAAELAVRVVNPVDLARELLPWHQSSPTPWSFANAALKL
jgi:hypothetical protein